MMCGDIVTHVHNNAMCARQQRASGVFLTHPMHRPWARSSARDVSPCAFKLLRTPRARRSKYCAYVTCPDKHVPRNGREKCARDNTSILSTKRGKHTRLTYFDTSQLLDAPSARGELRDVQSVARARNAHVTVFILCVKRARGALRRTISTVRTRSALVTCFDT